MSSSGLYKKTSIDFECQTDHILRHGFMMTNIKLSVYGSGKAPSVTEKTIHLVVLENVELCSHQSLIVLGLTFETIIAIEISVSMETIKDCLWKDLIISNITI